MSKEGDERRTREASNASPARVNGRGSEEKAERPGGKEGKEGDEDPEDWNEKRPKKPGGKGDKKGKIELDDLVNEDDVKSYFAANITMASAKAKSFLYKLDDDAVAASEMHNGRKDTLKTLRSMRKDEKWWAAASCGYRQCGKPGLSVGMLMMTKRDKDVILPHIDDECDHR